MSNPLASLRRHAIANTLFPPTSLQNALNTLGFVQADPIRAPARAQDLILRHRVLDYRVGDLEKQYADLAVEEDYLYAYGFVSRSTSHLLHPRGPQRLTLRERRVFDLVCGGGKTHPRQLGPHLGSRRERNAWGGYSAATTQTLTALHYRGHLRIAGRAKGIRIYEQAPPREPHSLTLEERLSKLIVLVTGILAPVPEKSLRSAFSLLKHAVPELRTRRRLLQPLIASGELQTCDCQGVKYLWPAGDPVRNEAELRVRFLAPFDPLVWDRYRFEQFWGWSYRFEAYTPVAKRRLGYYAMPLLWGERVVGWVNVTARGGELQVTPGFVTARPAGRKFEREFQAEVERLRIFLAGTVEEPKPRR